MSSLLRMQVALLAATAASATVSVFAAQVGLALVALVHLIRIIRRETRGFALPIDAAVGAFSIWTFLSASFAPLPIASHESAKKIVLFLLLYFAVEALQTEEARKFLLDGMLIGGLALSTLAILQYLFLGFNTMDTRPRSFLGHYMTASGVIMVLLLVAVDRIAMMKAPRRATPLAIALCTLVMSVSGVVAAAYRAGLVPTEVERAAVLLVALLAGRRAWKGVSWPDETFSNALALTFVPLGALALMLSRTRSAWIGVIAGLTVIAWMKKPRILVYLPGLLFIAIILSPQTILDRLTVTDASSRDRYYMWQAGVDMVADKPIFGQGTGMILSVYPKFRWEGAPNPNAPHLHNNFIQIAAERGLPCLFFLGWWLFLLAREAWRVRDTEHAGHLVIAVLAATLTAGMFEYNLGDSEILMLVLLLSALPFSTRAFARDADRAHAGEPPARPAMIEGSELVIEQ